MVKYMEYKFESVKELVRQTELNIKTVDRENLPISDELVKMKGGGWRLKLVESPLVQKLMYLMNVDYYKHRFSKSFTSYIKSEMALYMTEPEMADEKNVARIIKDIRRCEKMIQAKPYEYFFLNLRNLTDKERKTFVTDKYMLQKMSMTGARRLHDVELNEKYNFYLLAKPFFKREVVLLNKDSHYEEFEKVALSLGKMIFKPTSLGCGGGVFVAEVDTPEKVKQEFDKVVSDGGTWVAEELIKQTAEMASWNQTSVNTMRVLSFSTEDEIKFTTCFLRTGRNGAVVDNGGAGGVFAAVDDETGIVISDGKDEKAKSYACHPDSKQVFKGWQVPRWDELKETAAALHSIVFPYMKYIGWDFALTDQGWVVIEGNWGQFLQQAATGVGLRPVFDKYVK